MIRFELRQQSYGEQDLHVSLATHHEELGAVVLAFKEFLIRAGYHPETVDSIRWYPKDRQPLPMQIDWIDEHETGGI